jgi:hypothetical protein
MLNKPLGQVGVCLGLLISCLSAYVTSYGLTNLSDLSTLVEREIIKNEKKRQLDVVTTSLKVLCERINTKVSGVCSYILIYASFLCLYTSTTGNVILVFSAF